jgi:hypothetical protein
MLLRKSKRTEEEGGKLYCIMNSMLLFGMLCDRRMQFSTSILSCL